MGSYLSARFIIILSFSLCNFFYPMKRRTKEIKSEQASLIKKKLSQKEIYALFKTLQHKKEKDEFFKKGYCKKLKKEAKKQDDQQVLKEIEKKRLAVLEETLQKSGML